MMGRHRPRALPLPSLCTQTSTWRTSLSRRHMQRRGFLLFIIFFNVLLLIIFLIILFLLLVLVLFLDQTAVTPFCVCPPSSNCSSSLAFSQGLVLLLQPLQCAPGRRRKEKVTLDHHIMKLLRFKPLTHLRG